MTLGKTIRRVCDAISGRFPRQEINVNLYITMDKTGKQALLQLVDHDTNRPFAFCRLDGLEVDVAIALLREIRGKIPDAS